MLCISGTMAHRVRLMRLVPAAVAPSGAAAQDTLTFDQAQRTVLAQNASLRAPRDEADAHMKETRSHQGEIAADPRAAA
jgi:hypothetical protein